jgi:RNA polymerase sigma factor (TIGR02999 family)
MARLLPAADVPAMNQSPGVTQLLAAHGSGDEAAFPELFRLLYDDLHRRAHRQLNSWSAGKTLNTTALVNEAYLRLVDQSQASVRDRGHFLAIAARAMRNIIIDYARARLATKRGGGRAELTLDTQEIAIEDEAGRLVDLDAILHKLDTVNERLTQVVECRFFAGLTEEETAVALNTSVRTVQREWMRARAWLRANLAE